MQWVYEGTRAPGGVQRMTVDFGLLSPHGYKQTVVRAFRLEPKPKIFGKNTVAQAWGPPDAIGTQNNQDDLLLQVRPRRHLRPRTGTTPVLMTFTPPQPDAPPPTGSAPAAPKR